MGDPMRQRVPMIEGLVGANLRRVREEYGLTQEQVAQWMQTYGVKWTVSRVGEFEKGRLGLSLATFIQLANCLSNLTGTPFRLRDLLKGDDGVALSLSVGMDDTEELASLFEGAEVDYHFTPLHLPDDYNPKQLHTTMSEARAAKTLGITAFELQQLAIRTWNERVDYRRDRLAGEGASAQKRGIVMRQLITELQAAREAESNGNR
jgi:transcriptional regulator with XRE-family HTH domain